jgi:hypothetical protein
MQSSGQRDAVALGQGLAFGDRDLALWDTAVDRSRRVSSRRYAHTSQG